MIYVALLRGINAGGKNKVEMRKLKSTFEQAGMSNVTTYINSGNVVFVTTAARCPGSSPFSRRPSPSISGSRSRC
jgi:uncharacterized protein (DUF1697 family)